MLVDEPHAGGAEAVELRLDVPGAVRDVVERGAAALQEAPDRGLRTERLEELQHADESHPHTLLGELERGGTDLAGEEFEDSACIVERRDGDGHVIERKGGRERHRRHR